MAEDLKRLYKRRFEEELEPERYEIFDLLQDLTPDRREFLTVARRRPLLPRDRSGSGSSGRARSRAGSEDGTYRAFTGKMEMGQGSRTLLTQAFAEELGVAVDKVQLVMGDTLLCPDDGGTWSSLTSPQTVPVIRQAAAAVRAARAGGTDALTRPANWRTLGASVPNVDSRAIVTGGEDIPDRRLDTWHAACRHRAKSASSRDADVGRRRGRGERYRAFACSATPISSPSSRPIGPRRDAPPAS